jgi:hypothetical protein
MAEDADVSFVHGALRGEDAHGGGLACPVGAEQSEHDTLGDVQVEAVDGGDVAEAFHDPAERDRRWRVR